MLASGFIIESLLLRQVGLNPNVPRKEHTISGTTQGWSPVLACSRPETALFRDLGVNPRLSLCGVQEYASAESLDFLKLAENRSFLPRELRCSHPEFQDGN